MSENNGATRPVILFVCTGNIFRSMSAEYLLKAALGPEPQYEVHSMGTQAMPQPASSHVLRRLEELGADPRGHRQRKLDAEGLARSHLVVAMGQDHVDHLRTHFGREAHLFNQISHGKPEPILDGWEMLPDWASEEDKLRRYMEGVVEHLHRSMPDFIVNARRYLRVDGR